LVLNELMFQTCTQCLKESLFTSEPIYEGFKKVGETFRCTGCGAAQSKRKHDKTKADPLAALFGDDTQPEKIELFDVAAETAKLCRKCTHYVIHPFTQRCGLHDIVVLATDTCPQFEAKKEFDAKKA